LQRNAIQNDANKLAAYDIEKKYEAPIR